MTLVDRFLKYVTIDTQSDPESGTFPSTPGQVVLLRLLADEMRELGVAEVEMDGHGYVTGTIPATEGMENEPVVGFFAHVDTSPDAPGANVKPRITEKDGDTIISSDGTTLLGADDKAGVAEIITAAEYLLAHPEIRHGKVRVAFTPDEEIGRGVDHFDVGAFGADFAYTMDGGEEGELQYENFNAAVAKISIEGRSAHPGDAKGKMLNALRVALEFDAGLPRDERPETTSGYEGFWHLTSLAGTVESASMEYIIRDHDRALFEQRKAKTADVAARLNDIYGHGGRGPVKGAVSGGSGPVSGVKGPVHVAIEDQYYNMREVVELHPEAVERAREAMRRVGVRPVVRPVRGGTDGARLSYMGLPCPNLFAGGEDFHSRSERVRLSAMEKAVEVIVEIVAGV